MATTVIRDYATTSGGGRAVVHVEGCDELRRTPVEVQAQSAPGTCVTEQRTVDHAGWTDPRTVATRYARQFSVDFPVTLCTCAVRAVERLQQRRAADQDDAADQDN